MDASRPASAGRNEWPRPLRHLAWLLAWACAASAQQRCDDRTPSLPAERFEDLGDGTLTDQRNGLTWMRCSIGQQWDGGRCSGAPARLDWAAAHDAARALNAGGTLFFNDWRVPQLRELAQITEHRCRDPRTSLALFPGTPAAPYWTATPRAGDPSRERAYALDFGAAGVLLEPTHERLHVRLVRRAR